MVRILNFVFGEMKKTLKRGKEVEFPFGKLKRVWYDSIRYLELIEDWSASHEGYTVIHESDEVGEHLLNGRLCLQHRLRKTRRLDPQPDCRANLWRLRRGRALWT